MKESNVQKLVMCRLSELDCTPFRNNVGAYKNANGDFIRYGVGGKGGSDIIGATTITVTPEMVGHKIAVFTAPEVKTKKGRLREGQQEFIDLINSIGGISGIVRSEEDVDKMLGDFMARFS